MWGWILTIFIILIIVKARIKKKGYFWKDTKGEKLNSKQFFKRWGEGIEGITPLQQTKTQLMGTWITITGIVAGIVVNVLIRIEDMWWWITIILVGSLIITGVQMIGTYQKYKMQKKANELMKEAMNNAKKM